MASENSITLVKTPCREYRGARNAHGYGIRKRDIRRLHRWVVAQIGRDQFGTLFFNTPDQVVMHLCDNPPCFRYDHLRVANRSDNNSDAYRKGRRMPSGRKLTDAEVAAIRSSRDSHTDAAERYGVSRSLISLIRSNKRRSKDHGE